MEDDRRTQQYCVHDQDSHRNDYDYSGEKNMRSKILMIKLKEARVSKRSRKPATIFFALPGVENAFSCAHKLVFFFIKVDILYNYIY